MNSSNAIEYLKMGKPMTRRSYPSGNRVVFVRARAESVPIDQRMAEATGIPEKTLVTLRPYFLLVTSRKEISPWSPSGDDLATNDWVEYEGDD